MSTPIHREISSLIGDYWYSFSNLCTRKCIYKRVIKKKGIASLRCSRASCRLPPHGIPMICRLIALPPRPARFPPERGWACGTVLSAARPGNCESQITKNRGACALTRAGGSLYTIKLKSACRKPDLSLSGLDPVDDHCCLLVLIQ